MSTTLQGVTVSPVQMDNRKELGLKAGDTVRVHQRIQEKGKTRIQVFEGIVLARKHGNEPGATFTVRKVSSGVGVEKIYPLYSPVIDKIEIVKRSKVRRAKLYFIREKVAREIKRQMRRMNLVSMASMSEGEEAARVEAEAKAAEEAAKKAEEEATKAAEEAAAKEAEAKAAAEAAEATGDESADASAEETPAAEESAEAAPPSDATETEDEKKKD